MNRIFVGISVLAVAGCAAEPGAVRDIPLNTVTVRAEAGAAASAVGAALSEAGARVALVVGPADSAWYAAAAEAAGLLLTRPAALDAETGVAFLGLEAVGDTTLEIDHARGSFMLHDALFEPRERRWLDLLAFRLDDPADVAPAVRALIEYMATDVMPNAAVIIVVAVPGPDVGDAVARALSPAYFDARDCGAARDAATEVRMFFGPQALLYCQTAEAADRSVGDWIQARLVMGRR